MIKKLKLGLLSASMIGVLAMAGTALAATGVTYSSNANVTINGRTYIIQAGSTATSVVVNPTTLVVTLTSSGPFTLLSTNGDTLTNSGSVAAVCNSVTTTSVTLVATGTFTPTSVTACAGPSGTGGSGGGGGSSDTTPPSGTSVSINAGASTTSTLTSTLTLAATDATQMLISNDAAFAGASWETYATSKSWTLVSGDGVKTVYAKFRDAAGNMSTAISDTITVSASGTLAPAPVTLTITSTTPTPTTIAGCNGSTGFSTATGQSCSGNTVTVTTTTPVSIPGCNNGTSGFSVTSGGSCAGNTGSITTTTSYNFGTVTLRNGSKGNAVMELQRFLNRFLNLGLVVDGKLGPKTIAVIKTWQKSKGLVADGLIGPKTKAMMNVQAEAGY